MAGKKGNESLVQKLLRKTYQLTMTMGKKTNNGTILENEEQVKPHKSFFDLRVELNNGKKLDFSELRGKKVLLVNSASNCGYTGQYAELQELYEKHGEHLEIIAFPTNEFGNQEKGDDEEIAQICQINYGVTFPVAKKGNVLPGSDQQPAFAWLLDENQNGWNTHKPDWNFGKYLIDENGVLSHYFGPSISPIEDDFLETIQ